MTIRLTASHAILEQLARQHRRVVSDWRALVILRNATEATAPERRRWSKMPYSVNEVQSLLRQMRGRHELRDIDGLSHVYEVTVPYADTSAISEWEILMEVNPYAAISHGSALAFHGMTEFVSRRFFLTVSRVRPHEHWPIGTTSEDWHGIDLPNNHFPKSIRGQTIEWKRIRQEDFIGVQEYQYLGYPVRVTTAEKTLIDSIQEPQRSGGVSQVIEAWSAYRDFMDVEGLISLVERMNVNVLKQRVGFILTKLRIEHPRLHQWRLSAKRGGTSKLVASAPYAAEFSPEWSLSLNAPVEALDAR